MGHNIDWLGYRCWLSDERFLANTQLWREDSALEAELSNQDILSRGAKSVSPSAGVGKHRRPNEWMDGRTDRQSCEKNQVALSGRRPRLPGDRTEKTV